MAIINPEGFFNGDRLRRCSNAAQLHWPRLFLASDGFARLEINYARIIGRAYATFNPIPTEEELLVFIREYSQNHLLFLYQVGGPMWGQWDTQSEFLPRYKTAQDRRSPIPPEPAFTAWKRSYRTENKSFPKLLENLTKSSETFPCGVGGGVGVGIGDGRTLCSSVDERGADYVSGASAGYQLTDYSKFSAAIAILLGYNFNGPFGILYSARTAGELDGLQDTLHQPLRQPDMVAAARKFVTNQIPNSLTHGSANTASESKSHS
jgi:hypothetical protein